MTLSNACTIKLQLNQKYISLIINNLIKSFQLYLIISYFLVGVDCVAIGITNYSIVSVVKGWDDDRQASTERYGHISNWDTSRVTDMSFVFYKATSFKSDISNWDTSQVTDMSPPLITSTFITFLSFSLPLMIGIPLLLFDSITQKLLSYYSSAILF